MKRIFVILGAFFLGQSVAFSQDCDALRRDLEADYEKGRAQMIQVVAPKLGKILEAANAFLATIDDQQRETILEVAAEGENDQLGQYLHILLKPHLERLQFMVCADGSEPIKSGPMMRCQDISKDPLEERWIRAYQEKDMALSAIHGKLSEFYIDVVFSMEIFVEYVRSRSTFSAEMASKLKYDQAFVKGHGDHADYLTTSKDEFVEAKLPEACR